MPEEITTYRKNCEDHVHRTTEDRWPQRAFMDGLYIRLSVVFSNVYFSKGRAQFGPNVAGDVT
jgi:hypothetical protein